MAVEIRRRNGSRNSAEVGWWAAGLGLIGEGGGVASLVNGFCEHETFCHLYILDKVVKPATIQKTACTGNTFDPELDF